MPFKSPVKFEELTSPTCNPYSKCFKGNWTDTAREVYQASEFEVPAAQTRSFDESKDFR